MHCPGGERPGGAGETPANPDTVSGPATLATGYRQLRKAREDCVDQPGAADRAMAATGVLAARWLRAAGVACSGLARFVLMMGLGLPDAEPKQEVRQVQVTGRVRWVLDKPEPRLRLPTAERFSAERFEKSLRTVLNSVLFHSSGQDLTDWETYIEMVWRLTEPVLLGLAVLAVRGTLRRGN